MDTIGSIKSRPLEGDFEAQRSTFTFTQDGRLEKLEGLEFKTVETPDLKF
jgi:hypothetical protein